MNSADILEVLVGCGLVLGFLISRVIKIVRSHLLLDPPLSLPILLPVQKSGVQQGLQLLQPGLSGQAAHGNMLMTKRSNRNTLGGGNAPSPSQ